MAKNRKIAILTAAFAVAVVVLGAVMVNGAKDKEAEEPVAVTEPTVSEQVEPEQADPNATLLFASDYQEADQGAPSDNLRGILDAVKTDRDSLDGLIFCGDYSNVSGKSNYEITPEPAISEIKGIMGETYPDLTEENMIFTQGNHDPLTISIKSPGLHEFDDYIVYVRMSL